MNNQSTGYEKGDGFIKDVLELAPLGAFQADTEGNCFFMNKQLENILGLDPFASLGKKWMKSIHEEDIPAILSLIQNVLAEKKDIFDFVYRVCHPLKGIRWCKVNARFVFDEKGAAQYYIGFVEDITESTLHEHILKEANEKLERSNILLDVSQEISKTGGWEYDVKTDTVFRTKQMKIMLGIASDTSLATATSFYEEEDDKAIQKGMKEAIEQHKVYDLELRPKGTKKWFRTIGRPVVKDGKVELVRGAVTDITERKEYELALREVKEKLERSNLLLDVSQQLSGTAGWEFNLQTGEIFWTRQAYLLHDVEEDFVLTLESSLSFYEEEERKRLDRVARNAVLEKKSYDIEVWLTTAKNVRKCVRAIGSPVIRNGEGVVMKGALMDITQKKEAELELIRARDIAEDLAKTKTDFLSVMSHEIRTPLNGIIGIANLLKLNYLGSNAIKFSDKGEVTLLVKLVSVEKDKATLHFSVKDTGIGIPEHLHETIFESFKQVQQSAYRKHSGTGLGLTITKKLIELHDSQVFIRSSPGTGTEFYFELGFELANDKNSPARFAAIPVLAGYEKKLNGIRLLFVEDNPINVLVAKKQLEYFGVVPDCAYNGKEALVFLENNEYDAALLDLHMPEIDGYALAEIIRRQYPGIHIIIFTADIMTEVKVKLAKMNIYDILNKPFAPEKMFEILSKLTPRPLEGEFQGLKT